MTNVVSQIREEQRGGYRKGNRKRVSVCGLRKVSGRGLSTEQVYRAVWQGDMAGCEHVVYNVICQLRRKLKNPNIIRTICSRESYLNDFLNKLKSGFEN